MTEHDLIIEMVATKNGSFNRITCNEGHWITSWCPDDDILSFSASKIVCCPIKVDIESTYRCIDDETYNTLNEQREIAEKERFEKEKNNIV